MTLNYICPICQTNLSTTDTGLVCSNNHSFDRAKEGYFHLLPVQFKKSKMPGDSQEMVIARREFLATGHYSFLQQAIVTKLLNFEKQSCVLDLGCGEGFYTGEIANALNNSTVYGLDISKSAIKYAAKRYEKCNFSVASCVNSPFNDDVADIIVSVFAPVFSDEMQRLLKADGDLLIVSPGPNHLTELKNIIYSDVRAHKATELDEPWQLVSHQNITQQANIKLADLKNLVLMTPFAWKFRPEHWQALEQTEHHVITLDFYLSHFKKQNSDTLN